MRGWLNRIRRRLATRADSEHEMSLNRLAFLVLMTSYLLIDPVPQETAALVVMGLGSCALLALWLGFTSSGLYVRAVSQDPSVARMMGINADRLSLLVTSLSTAFAGVAGVLAGPYLSIDPGMDATMIVNCLIIVVIGGTGSIGGAIVAALLFGLVQVAGSVFLPSIAALVPYVLLMVVLLIAPRGIGRGRVLN